MEQSELGKGDVDLKKSFVGGDRRNVLKSSGSATSVSGVLNFLHFLQLMSVRDKFIRF